MQKRMNRVEFTRREIREKALQALYPFDFQQDLTKQAAISYALEYGQPKLVDAESEMFIPEYLDQLVTGVIEHQAIIDEKIKENLRNWSISRIAKTDLIIMRVAIYEIMFEESTPNVVALNEALELTKEYSDEPSRKFVNGVLSKIVS